MTLYKMMEKSVLGAVRGPMFGVTAQGTCMLSVSVFGLVVAETSDIVEHA